MYLLYEYCEDKCALYTSCNLFANWPRILFLLQLLDLRRAVRKALIGGCGYLPMRDVSEISQRVFAMAQSSAVPEEVGVRPEWEIREWERTLQIFAFSSQFLLFFLDFAPFPWFHEFFLFSWISGKFFTVRGHWLRYWVREIKKKKKFCVALSDCF